jgi:hypothetical protein
MVLALAFVPIFFVPTADRFFARLAATFHRP